MLVLVKEAFAGANEPTTRPAVVAIRASPAILNVRFLPFGFTIAPSIDDGRDGLCSEGHSASFRASEQISACDQSPGWLTRVNFDKSTSHPEAEDSPRTYRSKSFPLRL